LKTLHAKRAALPLAAVGLLALLALPAEARIRCKEGYQLTRGQPISTPYCQDEYLAEVARGYGMRVSGDAMRNSPSAKQRVCAFIGSDIRVREACHGYGDDLRGGARRRH
jgi:hypothetical protein